MPLRPYACHVVLPGCHDNWHKERNISHSHSACPCARLHFNTCDICLHMEWCRTRMECPCSYSQDSLFTVLSLGGTCRKITSSTLKSIPSTDFGSSVLPHQGYIELLHENRGSRMDSCANNYNNWENYIDHIDNSIQEMRLILSIGGQITGGQIICGQILGGQIKWSRRVTIWASQLSIYIKGLVMWTKCHKYKARPIDLLKY